MNVNNLLNRIIKVLLVINIIIMLTICSFFVKPVFAYNSTPSFSSAPSFQQLSESGLQLGYYVHSSTHNNVYLIAGSVGSDVRCGYVSSLQNFVFYSSSNFSLYYIYSNNNASPYSQSVSFDSSRNLYISQIGANAWPNILVETFSSLDDLIGSSDINNPSPSLYEGLNIPPGYLARILVSNGSQFTMLTTMGTDNVSFQDKWVYTSQWYKFNDSADPSVVMSSDGITIPWARYGNLNLLGQTNKAQFTISSTVGSYVWVYNPAYMVGQNADLYDTKLNSSIQLVDVQNVDQVRIFALSSSYGYNGVVSSTSTSSGITFDPDTQSWVNDNGDSVTPSDYGDTNVPATGSTIVQQLESFLSKLVERIERILVAPVDYINTLVAAASNFFDWLSGLWSWLPPAVSSALTAVLYIMACVGALKILWR